jgi:hypothetical protein
MMKSTTWLSHDLCSHILWVFIYWSYKKCFIRSSSWTNCDQNSTIFKVKDFLKHPIDWATIILHNGCWCCLCPGMKNSQVIPPYSHSGKYGARCQFHGIHYIHVLSHDEVTRSKISSYSPDFPYATFKSSVLVTRMPTYESTCSFLLSYRRILRHK